MDLLHLAAKIELDDSSYNKGIKGAERAAQSLQGKMSAMTVAMGNIAADMIRKGIGAVKDLVGGAVNAYADYEQLVGGVETLFGQSATKVQKYAKQAYKTAGLSANQYMETVTSFSASLLQGLDGDTETAADLANMAITDMADNANKMGTDMQSIQNAYQGFAKQNYTMLDNLKLGYGGTASEMIRLINDSGILEEEIEDLDGITFDQLVLAIHKIQEEMGITGTTAKEAASTIAGSKASLASAWEDLLSAVGGEGGQDRLDQTLENFKTSFSTYMENFIPSLAASISNSGALVEAIGEAIGNLPTNLLGDLIRSGAEAGTGLISGVSDVVQWLIDSLADTFRGFSADSSQIEDFAYAVGDFVGTTIAHILENIDTFIVGLADLGIAIVTGLVGGIVDGLTGDDSEAKKITDALQESLTSIDVDTLKADGLIDYLDSLLEKYGEGATQMTEWQTAQEELEKVMPGAGQAFEDYGKDVGGAVDKLREMNQELRNAAIANALQKASQEEMELLATQTLEYNRQKGRYERNAQIQESGKQDIISAIQAAAQTALTDLEAQGELLPFQMDQAEALRNLVAGYDDFGNTRLEDLDLGSLWSALEALGQTDVDGMDLEAYKQAFTAAQVEMDSASTEMNKLSGEIAKTNEAIALTKAAMDETVNSLIFDASAARDGGTEVYEALSGAADKINSVNIGGENAMPQATGMDYVPYDGFVASLHRGERIVTASDNKKMSSGVDLSGLESSIAAAVRAGMQDVTVKSYLNGRDITAEVNRQNINELKTRRYGA